MVGCIADTNGLDLSIDGLGVLRGDVRVNGHVNNPLELNSAGLVVRSAPVRYGFTGSVSDTYSTPLAVLPASGYVEYGPRLAAAVAAPFAPTSIQIIIGWEIQAGYSALNTFSGINFALELSTNGGASWVRHGEVSSQSANPHTFGHRFDVNVVLAISSTATVNLLARSLVDAGSVAGAAGATVTAQFTRRRSITVMY